MADYIINLLNLYRMYCISNTIPYFRLNRMSRSRKVLWNITNVAIILAFSSVALLAVLQCQKMFFSEWNQISLRIRAIWAQLFKAS